MKKIIGKYRRGLSSYTIYATDTFIFVFTHPEFSEMAARAADLLAACQQDVYKAWTAFQKGAKKK